MGNKIVKKCIIILLLIILIMENMSVISSGIDYVESNEIDSFEQRTSEIIDDDKVYVQHDSNNKDIYLLESEGPETVIYEIIDATYTPCKQWTKDGLYIDDTTGKISATSPENYITVQENEVYFVRLYGIGDIYKGTNGDEWHITTPIVYFDDNGNCVGSDLSATCSSSKSGVEITIPKNATRMYISNYNNQEITIQKKLILNEEKFNIIKEKQDELLASLDSNYEKEKQDRMLYDEYDKCYITFVNDDSRPNVDKFADLFISKNAPLCFAAISDNLLNIASNLTETRLDVALRVQEAGGEILAHNSPVITEDTINDNNFMYNYFAVQKQILTRMGFNVNGIILAGGNGQIVGSSLTAKWVNSLYEYSDLLGEDYTDLNGYESVYFNRRTGLGNYKNDLDKIKSDIDSAIESKSWNIYYFHDTNEITLETLEEIIDYINSKGSDKVEIVTYKTIYDKFAKRESVIKNNVKTYYVSSDGTSDDGTDINNPINLQTLKTKKIKSGDTILFKSEDTFFGTLDLQINSLNDKEVTISNYGDGDLPTICTYKNISTGWEKYTDNIYRIDIKNTLNYTGYTSESSHAFNVGFLEDNKNNKYYNKKISIEALSNKYDFYSDGSQYLYMYTDTNPYEELGNLKVVVRSNLMMLYSNMQISNIRFAYTGGHAVEGCCTNIENIQISNCIFENIGGSYLNSSSLSSETRYGNGIEFYGCNAKNIIIKDNIFRNIYDVAFTIQGTSGSGTNIDVYDNVFIKNTQDSEIWESGSATGINNYTFHNNISINQGRGWGYDARPDKYAAGHILFWGYKIENTDIYFSNNIVYNPRRIYFIEQTNGTNIFFKETDYIKSNENIYWLAEDAKIFRDSYQLSEKDDFIKEYNKDSNSIFNALELDENIISVSNNSNNIKEIRKLFGIEDHTEHTGGIATCTQKAICSVCGIEYGEYDETNHNTESKHIVNQKSATCVEEGYTGDIVYDCCNQIKEYGKIILKLEHTYDGGKITKEATYENDGEKAYTCILCSNIKVETIPKLNKISNDDEKDDVNNNISIDKIDTNTTNNENENNNSNNNDNYDKIQEETADTNNLEILPYTGIKSQTFFWLLLLFSIINATYYGIKLKKEL